jgi:putative chitinase
MPPMTFEQLRMAMPYAADRAGVFYTPLSEAMQEFEIDSPLRAACFIAQVAHESGSLRYTREIADGSAYEGRADLGNTVPGDGKRYPGRGLLQITGRTNTLACLAALHQREDALEYLELPIGASRSACWYWKTRRLNEFADLGNFWSISKIINGGTVGLDDRIRHYIYARKAFGL